MDYINTTELIENKKFNKFHLKLLLLCAFIITIDGYDLGIYGSVLPVIIKEWSLTPIEAGTIGSYGFIGMMLGAIFFGSLADKIGRKHVIIVCIVLFSLFTALTGFATSPGSFSIFRFVAGIGIGGVIPNIIALMTDYAPKAKRNTLVTLVMCGYSVGGMLAPSLSIVMIPELGWKSVYWVAALPLIFLPLMYKMIPDSASFLLAKGRTNDLNKVLTQLDPDYKFNENTKFEKIENKNSGFLFIKLFNEKRGLSTVMFWTAAFMSLLMVYGLGTWLPKLMMTAGYALNSSLTFLITLNAGAIIGAIIWGNMADKWGPRKVLIPVFFLGAICLVLLGFKYNMFILYVLVAIAGACTIGAQHMTNAFVSQYYPAYVRSTALGVTSGVGRVGAILGPTLGGILVAMSLSLQTSFIVFAIPGVIVAVAFYFVREKYANNFVKENYANNKIYKG